jgi:hypothetical protein
LRSLLCGKSKFAQKELARSNERFVDGLSIIRHFLQQIAVVLHKLQSSKSMQHYSSSASEPTTKLLPPDAPKTAGQTINSGLSSRWLDKNAK